MSLSMGQVPVTGTLAAFSIPPGVNSVTLYGASTGIYVGPGTPLTTSNGLSVPTTTPVSFRTWPGSQGATIFATLGTVASTVTLFYLVSSAR